MKRIIFYLLPVTVLMIACNNDKKTESADNKETVAAPPENKAEKNRQTALAAVMAINAHDVDGMLKEAAADCVDMGDGSMSPIKGADSIKASMKSFLMAFPDVKGENLEVLSNADGSKVAVLGAWSATFKNDFMGMKATGKAYNGIKDADIFTFDQDGKVTSHSAIQNGITYINAVAATLPK